MGNRDSFYVMKTIIMGLLFLKLILLTKKPPKNKKFLSKLPIMLELGPPLHKLLPIFVLVKIQKILLSKTMIFLTNKKNYDNKF